MLVAEAGGCAWGERDCGKGGGEKREGGGGGGGGGEREDSRQTRGIKADR